MVTFSQKVVSILNEIKGTGNYCSIGDIDFVLPQMSIEGVGEIAFPINKVQAKTLINHSTRSSFGKGSETIKDLSVRKGWEIEPDAITFSGTTWKNLMQKILKNVKKDLGLNDVDITAELYKLLIYEKGDFFLKHKDTEKEKDMFGTLVIGMPSIYNGGELVISFDGTQSIADFSKKSSQLNYSAFYADCDHEIKPIVSGYRVCLVYNLIQKSDHQISANTATTYIDKFEKILTTYKKDQPLIILLGHQYTPENFSEKRLKLNDRLKGNVIKEAAHRLGYYMKYCLVTSFVTGMPEDGYDSETLDIEEVFDEYINIEHWLKSEIPDLGGFNFEDEDIISSFPINGGDPIETENTGYMGNYGPDINHWYHYGALVIWSKKSNAKLLHSIDLSSRLKWLTFFVEVFPNVSEKEISVMNELLKKKVSDDEYLQKADFNNVAKWLVTTNQKEFLLDCSPKLLRFYFSNIKAENWSKVLNTCSEKSCDYLLFEVSREPDKFIFKTWVGLINFYHGKNKHHSLSNKLTNGVIPILKELFNPVKTKKVPIGKSSLFDLILLDGKVDLESKTISEIISAGISRKFIHKTLAPVLLEVKQKNDLQKYLLNLCTAYLQKIIDNIPQPPQDWKRSMPHNTKDYPKVWAELKSFIEDPERATLDIRRRESDRKTIENALFRAKIDLRTETIRLGSPHTLRITKTNKSYDKELANWKEDSKLLKKLWAT